MNFCNDCKFWTEQHHKGECDRLTCKSNLIQHRISWEKVETEKFFGCIHFEPKFEVRESKYGYFICYKPKNSNLGHWTSANAANITCNMLNKEWMTTKEEMGRTEVPTKDLIDYLSLPYTIEFTPSSEGQGFTATIPLLKGCISFGDSLQEAYEMIIAAKRFWIETALDKGWDVPEPVT